MQAQNGYIFQVSNRVVKPEIKDGKIVKKAGGGLDAATDRAFDPNRPTIRVGWSGETAYSDPDKTVNIDPDKFDWRIHGNVDPVAVQISDTEKVTYCTVDLPQELIDRYYNRLANLFWWFSNHDKIEHAKHPYLTKNGKFNIKLFEADVKAAYQVNQIFVEILKEKFDPNSKDTVIVHDSHVVHVGKMLREVADCAIGYFLHTPMLNKELFKKLHAVQRKYVLKTMEDMLAYNFLGFQRKVDLEKFSALAGVKVRKNIELNKSYEIPRSRKFGKSPNKTRYGVFQVVGNYEHHPAEARAAGHEAKKLMRKKGLRRPPDVVCANLRGDPAKGLEEFGRAVLHVSHRYRPTSKETGDRQQKK